MHTERVYLCVYPPVTSGIRSGWLTRNCCDDSTQIFLTATSMSLNLARKQQVTLNISDTHIYMIIYNISNYNPASDECMYVCIVCVR